jgi:hypothetical protein
MTNQTNQETKRFLDITEAALNEAAANLTNLSHDDNCKSVTQEEWDALQSTQDSALEEKTEQKP